MAEQVELEIAPREMMGKAAKRLRKAGIIPANIYGHKEASRAIQINGHTFERLQRTHGTRNIIALRLPGAATETALIRHIQHDPRTGKILHVDFSRVSLSERLTVKIPIQYVGESLSVKNNEGVLLHLLEAVEVECRASDIIDHLELDISPLAEIDATLYARDVKLPENYTLVTDPDEPIVKIAATRAEIAEEEAAAAAAEGEAAPAEGATPPAEES